MVQEVIPLKLVPVSQRCEKRGDVPSQSLAVCLGECLSTLQLVPPLMSHITGEKLDWIRNLALRDTFSARDHTEKGEKAVWKRDSRTSQILRIRAEIRKLNWMQEVRNMYSSTSSVDQRGEVGPLFGSKRRLESRLDRVPDKFLASDWRSESSIACRKLDFFWIP